MLFELKHMNHSAPITGGDVHPRLNRAEQALADTFPDLRRDTEYPYATGAEWSTMDLIAHLLGFTGPSHLAAAAWSVSEAAAVQLAAAIQEGRLISVRFLVDWRVQVRTPGFLAQARTSFTDVRVSSCHAKIFVLRNADWAVSCVGSANFTSNPRIEAGHLSTTPAIADFHEKWITDEIQKAQPFGCDMRKRGKPDGRK